MAAVQPKRAMSTSRKLLISVFVVGILGSVSALGVFGLFSATTQNAGNEISTGTVAIGDNDAGASMFNITNAEPGDSWSRCIKVTYTGSLPADVHNYLRSTPGALTPYLHLKLEQGTQSTTSFPDCTGFTAFPAGPPPKGGVVTDGPISSALFGDWNSGLVESPNADGAWRQGDSLVLRMTLSLSSSMPDMVQGSSTGTAAVVWEARNR